jgi:hypothetical protein
MKKEALSSKERRHYVRNTNNTTHNIVTIEKRKYIRLGFQDRFNFTLCTRDSKKASAAMQDISQSGIHFTSDIKPKKNAIISIKLSNKSLSACLKLEKLLQEDDGEIIGKITRVEPTKNKDLFEISAVFLKKGL